MILLVHNRKKSHFLLPKSLKQHRKALLLYERKTAPTDILHGLNGLQALLIRFISVRTAGKFSAAPEEFSHRSLDTGTRLEKEAGSEEKTYFVDAVFLDLFFMILFLDICTISYYTPSCTISYLFHY